MLCDTDTPKAAKAKMDLIDKFFSDERLYSNEKLVDKFGGMLHYTDTPEKTALLDKFLSDERLYNKKILVNAFEQILHYTDTPEAAKVKMDLIDKFLSNERLYNNEKLIVEFGNILLSTATPKEAKVKMDLIDKFLSDERLYNNEKLVDKFGNILLSAATPKAAKAKMDLIDKFLSDERLYNNEKLVDKFGNILLSAATPKAAKAKMDLIDKFLSDERLYNNEKLVDKFWVILRYTDNPEAAAVLDKFLSDERLYNNEKLVDNFGEMLRYTDNPEAAALAEKFFSDERLYGNQKLVDKIGGILCYTDTPERAALAEKFFSDERLYGNQNLTDTFGKILRTYNKDSKPLIDTVIANKEIDSTCLAGIVDAIVCKDNVNRGNIDTSKVRRYTALLENPKTAPFMIKNLNKGMDIDTAAFLFKTRQRLDSEKVISNPAGKKDVTTDYTPNQIETFSKFIKQGLNEKESTAIIKAITTADGKIDGVLENKAVELINAGISKNKIGDILNSARISGKYNPKIVDDFVSVQNIGLNPLLEKNIAILNNISAKTVGEKFNSKVKKQLIGMIENLPDGTKILLETKGFDINSIIEKLNTKPIKFTNAPAQKVIVPEGMRVSKSKLTGFEKIVVDKYNPAENIWRSEANTKKWAEEKYSDFKKHDYDSRLYPDANAERRRILNEWFDFMDSDPDIKNNPFVKIILSEFITKDLEPENAWLPPALDKTLIKEVLNSAYENQNISITGAYAKKLKAKAQKTTIKEEINVDGIRGTWYTVPQTDKSSPDFEANVNKVKTFSDGTNWCIKTYNAEPYTQKGAMHFFVDENGLTQVCIREEAPGRVAEIQKRQQDATRPIPYIYVIKDFIDRYQLETPAGYLDNALKAKPKFDLQRKSFNEAAARGDYKYILEQMGISVKVLPDNTYEISHYNPTLGEYTINDLGIKENDLLSNVSIIRGDATFENSNATALPQLKEVGGKFIFDGSNISDVRNLREINGYKVYWE